MEPTFLTHENKQLFSIVLPAAPVIKEGSRSYRKGLEQVRLMRIQWARQLGAISGLHIIGSSDGSIVRLINQKQFTLLVDRLRLDTRQSDMLLHGKEPTALSFMGIIPIGVAVAGEVEAEFRRTLDSEKGIAGWLRSLPPGTLAGNSSSGAFRSRAEKELSLFWPWVSSMGWRHHFRRKSSRNSGPGLRLQIRNLLERKRVTEVLVITEENLKKVPIDLTESVANVATCIEYLAQSEVTPEQAQVAERFFSRLGLEVIRECPRLRKGQSFPSTATLTLNLSGTLKKSWKKSVSEQLVFPSSIELTYTPAQLLIINNIFIEAVSRLLNAAGITSDLTVLEDSSGPIQSTGLVERVRALAEYQIRLAALKQARLKVAALDVPKLTNVYVARNTTTVYDAIKCRYMTPRERAFWEPTQHQALWAKKIRLMHHKGVTLTDEEISDLKPQARSLVVAERMEDVRLSSILNGAASGWISHYVRFNASENLKGILDGRTDEAAPVPRSVWKELRWLFCYAKIWAARELFERGDQWLGISPAYRCRLSRELKTLFDLDKHSLESSEPNAYFAYCTSVLTKGDSYFNIGEDWNLQGHCLTEKFEVGNVSYHLHLLVGLYENSTEPQYKTRAADTKTLYRLLGHGWNMSRRLMMCAQLMRANGSRLPKVAQPLLPLDGPDPLSYVESLEASGGNHLEKLFQLPVENKELAFGVLKKKGSPSFSLDIFDPFIGSLEKNVSVKGLKKQWAWASRYPRLVCFGHVPAGLEITLMRLAWNLSF